MKTHAILLFCLSTSLVAAQTSHFESSIDVEVGNVRAFLSSLNTELGLRLDSATISDYAASIAVGARYSDRIDLHYEGIVFTATYKIAKRQAGRVELSLGMAQKKVAKAICEQMAEFSRTSDAKYGPKSCEYDLLERIKI